MIEIDQNIPGIEEASKMLDALEAADAAQTNPTTTEASPGESVNQSGSEHAAPPADDPQQPNSLPSDTPADTEAANDKQQQKEQKPPEPTRYAKAKERQEKGWQELNRQKTDLEAQRKAFEEERQRWNAERAKPAEPKTETKPQYTADDYEAAAKKWEEEGRFDMADAAKAKAAELRRNPPPAPTQTGTTQQQAQAQQAFVAQQREWWMKAAEEFPEVAKKGSALNVALGEILKAEPDIAQHPKGLYYAAQLVASRTAAARVPEMEKELGSLRAKVKELEALTAPSGPGGAQRAGGELSFDQKSDAEQLAELSQMAHEMGVLR